MTGISPFPNTHEDDSGMLATGHGPASSDGPDASYRPGGGGVGGGGLMLMDGGGGGNAAAG